MAKQIIVGHNESLTVKVFLSLIKSLWSSLGFVLNPFDFEFPTGLVLPRTILSLVCLKPDRCCKSFS